MYQVIALAITDDYLEMAVNRTLECIFNQKFALD